jgi:hypothetical protein
MESSHRFKLETLYLLTMKLFFKPTLEKSERNYQMIWCLFFDPSIPILCHQEGFQKSVAGFIYFNSLFLCLNSNYPPWNQE